MADKDKRSLEDIQREIADVELQTKKLMLAEAKHNNQVFEAKEAQRHAANRQRMQELEDARRNREQTVKHCRHRSGGRPQDVLKGGGIGSFSTISRAIMPDGVTILLQCPRCRMQKYPPSLAMKLKDAEKYLEELKEYNRLLEVSRSEGLEFAELRGPTFLFTKDGIPFIPERV
jgi:hypothetical protein